MKSKWLIKNNFTKLIIFFNGWSLDEKIVERLQSTQYNVLMFNDYENLEIPQNILNEIQDYREKFIIAWSFGVWACSMVAEQFQPLNNIIAINGTPVPISNNFGIPEKIFKLTLSGLSEKTYPKFFQNMFNNFEETFNEGFPKRSIENQKKELLQIQDQSSTQNTQEKAEYFNKIFVGLEDKIIPAKNQINFWGVNAGVNTSRITEFDAGHCLFNLFDSWDKIVEYE